MDPEKREVSIYRQEGVNRFGLAATLDRSRLLATPLLPGFALPLDELFA